MAAQPIVSGIKLLRGGPEVMAATLDRIGRHEGRIGVELYQAAYAPYTEALERHVTQGRPLDLLVNRHVATTPGGIDPELLGRLERAGARVSHYDPGAEKPAWMHTKSIFFEGASPAADEAWIGNLAASEESLVRNELTVVVSGERARAVDRMAQAAARDDVPAMRDAALGAARLGVLVNDRRAGVHTITEAVEDIVRSTPSGGELRVVTKGVDNIAMSTLLAEAAGRGVDVRLTVRDLAVADAEILERAGVKIDQVTVDAEPSMRVNYVAGGGRAYLGTAFLWGKLVDPVRGTSRDAGVLLGGAAAEDAARAVEEIVGELRGGVPIERARAGKLLKGTLTKKPHPERAVAAGLLAPPAASASWHALRGRQLLETISGNVDAGLAQLRAAAHGGDVQAMHEAARLRFDAAREPAIELRHAIDDGAPWQSDAQRLVATRLAADLVYLQRAAQRPNLVAHERIARIVPDAEQAVAWLSKDAAVAGQGTISRDFAADARERGLVTTAEAARAWLQRPDELDRAHRVLRTGAPDAAEPDVRIGLAGKGQNFHGALPVRTFQRRGIAGAAVQAVHKLPVDGAQEALAADLARTLGIGHLLPAYARRADGSFAIEYLEAKTFWRARVRKPAQLDRKLAAWYRREFPALPEAEAQRAARTDRQLMQFLDHLVANPDRHTMNGLVELETGRPFLIDHGFAGRGETSDPLVTRLKFSYQGKNGTTELDPETLHEIRTRLTDDVLDAVHARMREYQVELPAEWAARLRRDSSAEFLANMRARRDDVLATGRYRYVSQRLDDHPLQHELEPGANR